jgi:hypothetical protein
MHLYRDVGTIKRQARAPLGPFHLIYTPPYGREFLRGLEKAVSEGLCASASFDLCVFSEG